jgi:hypothetical protein
MSANSFIKDMYEIYGDSFHFYQICLMVHCIEMWLDACLHDTEFDLCLSCIWVFDINELLSEDHKYNIYNQLANIKNVKSCTVYAPLNTNNS